MLKMTGVTLVSDPDKYMFFEQGMEMGLVILTKDIANHLKM